MNNLDHILLTEDPDGFFAQYVEQLRSGKLNIADDVPEDVLNLLKTSTPADFNNNENLDWKYIVREGEVWQIDTAPDGYEPQDEDEAAVLALIKLQHRG